MQIPLFLEPNGFCFWKARFETYVKSKDIDLWQVIQNSNFYFEVEDSKTKEKKETSYELLKESENGGQVLDDDRVASKTTKENVKYLAFKAKVTREQTSDDSDSQDESDEEVDEEEELRGI
ncbi:hypothetical protein Tco_0200603 [Tanacetum coccineum]